MILAVDTETTGTDFWRGCKPFMVSACDGSNNYLWEGRVNPYNRLDITWKTEDLQEAQDVINQADAIIMHNAKFDVRALETVDILVDWEKVKDTVVGAHLCCSGENHQLKYLASKYLDYPNTDQKELALAVQRARAQHKDEYDIAVAGHPAFPGLKGTKVKWYAMDYWLCMEECRKYACTDVEMTWHLWEEIEYDLHKRNLYEIYEIRNSLLPIFYKLEETGIHVYKKQIDQEIKRLKAVRILLQDMIQSECKIAHQIDLTKEKWIKFFLFDVLKLDVLERSEKTHEPTTNKKVISRYIKRNPESKPLQHFKQYREAGTQITYLSSYQRWAYNDNRIRPSFNLTGTRETRQSASNPPTQNIDKKLRYIFGPEEGYVHLVYDLVNIEMRIWGYAVGNKEMKRLFDTKQSFHNEIAKILYPQEYAICVEEDITFKNKYKETLYQWIKNGNFSIIYGAGQNKADLTYKKPGAYNLLVDRFPEVPVFTQAKIDEVFYNNERYGIPFVTCLGGYPLEINLDQIYTTACNYYAQGSAGYIIGLAMREVARNELYIQTGAQMINQVHDSLYIEVREEHVTDELKESLKASIEKGGEILLPTCEAELEDIITYQTAV